MLRLRAPLAWTAQDEPCQSPPLQFPLKKFHDYDSPLSNAFSFSPSVCHLISFCEVLIFLFGSGRQPVFKMRDWCLSNPIFDKLISLALL